MAEPILPDNSTTEQSRRRRFNRSERAALYWVADGRCEECGVPLDDGFHADLDQPSRMADAINDVRQQALEAMKEMEG